MMVPRPYRCAPADAYSLLPASGRAGANKMQPGEDEEDNDDDDETVIYGGNDEDEDDGPSPPPSMGRVLLGPARTVLRVVSRVA